MPLLVSKEFDLIQYAGKSYRVPASAVPMFYAPENMEKSIAVFRKSVMKSKRYEIECENCRYSEGRIKNDAWARCWYLPDSGDPQWLSYFSAMNNGKGAGFAARRRLCVVDTGVMAELIVEGKLDEYLIDPYHEIDGVAGNFPYVTEIGDDTLAEKRAIELYNSLKKQFKPAPLLLL